MANAILNQFAHLKQPACDYLSQVDKTSPNLTDLTKVLKQLIFLMKKYTKFCNKLINNRVIPVAHLEDLHLCQIQGVKYLRQTAEDIEALRAFEAYSSALAKQEVAHG